VPEGFLEETTINGWLNLDSLTTVPEGFLEGTTINGGLDLRSLNESDKLMVKSSVQKLEVGYNKENGYCFFDDILSKVLNVSTINGYTIYTTPFEYICQKDQFTAHGKTIRKAIEDLEFKILTEKVKHEPISLETEITVQYYRMLTGACDNGIQSWMTQNNIPFEVIDENTIEKTPQKVKDLLPLLEKTNAYGIDKIKKLLK